MKETKLNSETIKEIIKNLDLNFDKKIKLEEVNPQHKKIIITYIGKIIKLYDNIFSVDVYFKDTHFIKSFSYNKIVMNELTYSFVD